MRMLKNISKRGLALFVSLLMCLSLLPGTAGAAELTSAPQYISQMDEISRTFSSVDNGHAVFTIRPESTVYHWYCGHVFEKLTPVLYAHMDDYEVNNSNIKVNSLSYSVTSTGHIQIDVDYTPQSVGTSVITVGLYYKFNSNYHNRTANCTCGQRIKFGDYNSWRGFVVSISGINVTEADLRPTPATYTVTYTDGVSGAAFGDVSQNLPEGSPTPTFESLSGGKSPTRTGYTFKGWDPEIAETVTGNATYVAKWQCSHTNVTYTDNRDDTHDGVCDECHEIIVDDESHSYENGVCTKCGAEEPEPTPAATTYTVNREYYLNRVMAASVESRKEWSGNVGDTITGATLAANNPKWNNYTIDGVEKEFAYTPGTPDSIVLVEDAASNVITLRYDRTEVVAPSCDHGTTDHHCDHVDCGNASCKNEHVDANNDGKCDTDGECMHTKDTNGYCTVAGCDHGTCCVKKHVHADRGDGLCICGACLHGTDNHHCSHSGCGNASCKNEHVDANNDGKCDTDDACMHTKDTNGCCTVAGCDHGTCCVRHTHKDRGDGFCTCGECMHTKDTNGCCTVAGCDHGTCCVRHTHKDRGDGLCACGECMHTKDTNGCCTVAGCDHGTCCVRHTHKDRGDGFCTCGECMHTKDTNGYCTVAGCDHGTCCEKPPVTRYTVTYTDGVEDEEIFEDQVYTAEENSPTPGFIGIPVREGYTFLGWKPEVAAAVTGNATYEAMWRENDPVPETFTVTFDSNDGAWMFGANPRYTWEVTGIASGASVTDVAPVNPARADYVFMGWGDDAGNTVATINGNTTLYAQWTPVEKDANLLVTKNIADGLTQVSSGATVMYGLSISNNGEVDLYNLSLVDVMDSRLTLYTDTVEAVVSNPDGTVDAARTAEINASFDTSTANTLTWNLASLPKGALITVLYGAKATNDSDVNVKLPNTLNYSAQRTPVVFRARAMGADIGAAYGSISGSTGAEIEVTPEVTSCSTHEWGEWVTTKDPTETEPGQRERTCTKCGEKETESFTAGGGETPVDPSVDPHSHSYNWVVTRPATETSEGLRTGTCACGDTVTETIPRLPHTTHVWSAWTVVTPATEAASGLERRTCSVCGLEETREISRLAHTTHVWGEWAVTTPATAITDGVETRACTVDGCTATETRVIPATGLPATPVDPTPVDPTPVDPAPVTPNPVTPGSTGGTTTIPDEDTPLAGAPDKDASLTDIADEDTPLAGLGLNTQDHIAYIRGYGDGTVRPTANITRAETATIFFRLMTEVYRAANLSDTNSFTDVRADLWYNEAISTAAKAGILKGYTDGTFAPDRNITRAEFAAIAARFLGTEAEGEVSFSDISGHWAESEIKAIANAGWIKGYSDGTFRPDQTITRAEAVAIINRMLGRNVERENMLEDMATWTDNPENEWYYEDIQEATNDHEYDRGTGIEIWTNLR